MCITEERKQNMSISDPYLYNTQAMVMKKSREKGIYIGVPSVVNRNGIREILEIELNEEEQRAGGGR